jgi:hypothetical protein
VAWFPATINTDYPTILNEQLCHGSRKMGNTTFFNEMSKSATWVPTSAVPPESTEPSSRIEKVSPDNSNVIFVRQSSQASKMLWFISGQQHPVDSTATSHCTRLYVPIISGDK